MILVAGVSQYEIDRVQKMSPNQSVRRVRRKVMPCYDDVFKTMFGSVELGDSPVGVLEGLDENLCGEELGDVGEATINGLKREKAGGRKIRKAPCGNCKPLIVADLYAAFVHRLRLRRVMADPDRFGLTVEEAKHIRYCLLPVYQFVLKNYLSGLASDKSESESEGE